MIPVYISKCMTGGHQVEGLGTCIGISHKWELICSLRGELSKFSAKTQNQSVLCKESSHEREHV